MKTQDRNHREEKEHVCPEKLTANGLEGSLLTFER
jgi:hypothetical protein